MARYFGAHIFAEGITHRYRNAAQPALADLSLTIEPGEKVALIGRSGSGKSTLLHILAGLVRPSHGSVSIDGRNIDGPSPSWVMMFQQPSLLPWMTVAQNVALGLRFAGKRDLARKRVPELLELVELSTFANRNVQELSGGQQQRVALARSLALEPTALFLDEPFSALDAFTRASLQRDVRAIAERHKLTLVLVTHDINEAALMADRAFIMAANPGRLVTDIQIEPGAAEGGEPLQRARRTLLAAYEQVAGSQFEHEAPETGAAAVTPLVARSKTDPVEAAPRLRRR